MDSLVAIGYWVNIALILINFCWINLLYYRTKKAWLRAIKFFLLSLILIELASRFISMYLDSNLFLINISMYLNFLFIGAFYHVVLKNQNQKKAISYFKIIGSILLILLFVFDPKSFKRINLFEVLITHYFLIGCALLYSYNTISGNNKFKQINTGIVVYAFMNGLLLLFGNIISNTIDFIANLAYLYHLFSMIFLQSMIALQLYHFYLPNSNKSGVRYQS